MKEYYINKDKGCFLLTDYSSIMKVELGEYVIDEGIQFNPKHKGFSTVISFGKDTQTRDLEFNKIMKQIETLNK